MKRFKKKLMKDKNIAVSLAQGYNLPLEVLL